MFLQFLTATGGTGTGTGAPTGLGGADIFTLIVPMILIIGVFYFVMIRPENKRKKEAEQLRSNVKNGDQITTIGGITGTVVHVKEDRFVIETGADQVRLELMKWALSTNETAAAAAKAEQERLAQERAKEKAAKKAARAKEK